jgi:isopenicillin N synthase-like dioxygenase
MSAPFFFDPNFDCLISPLTQFSSHTDTETQAKLKKKFTFPLKYGDYILDKVKHNFPNLKEN